MDFDDLPNELRADVDVDAYADPARLARAFGNVTLPTHSLRRREVAGESHYQPALDAIAGPKLPEGVWVEKVATLRPEPDNPYDDQAVAVDIDSRLVGHLPHADATTHRRLIDQTIAAHGVATCAAVINGGWNRPGEGKGNYGVRLYFGRTASATASSAGSDPRTGTARSDTRRDRPPPSRTEHVVTRRVSPLVRRNRGHHPRVPGLVDLHLVMTPPRAGSGRVSDTGP